MSEKDPFAAQQAPPSAEEAGRAALTGMVTPPEVISNTPNNLEGPNTVTAENFAPAPAIEQSVMAGGVDASAVEAARRAVEQSQAASETVQPKILV